jgi:hypothetical protein
VASCDRSADRPSLEAEDHCVGNSPTSRGIVCHSGRKVIRKTWERRLSTHRHAVRANLCSRLAITDGLRTRRGNIALFVGMLPSGEGLCCRVGRCPNELTLLAFLGGKGSGGSCAVLVNVPS